MKKLRNYLWLLICLATLFSCSKDENKLADLDPQKATLSFGSLLNNMVANKAMLKNHLDDLPECSDGVPAYVEVALSQDGTWVVGSDTTPLRVDLNSNPADYDGDGTDNYFTKESPQLELDPGTYALEYFTVFDADGNQLWIAPREGAFDAFVDDALPLNISLGAGVKKYVNVDVICYDRRMANEYGYLFFDINQSEFITFCIFGNYCNEIGRHFPAHFSVDVWSYSGDPANPKGQVIENGVINTVGVNSDGDAYAEPVCLMVPDMSGLDEYYFEITLLTSTEYDAEESIIRSGVITDEDVRALYSGDDTTKYFHFREGNCGTTDTPDLFDMSEDNMANFTVTIKNMVIPKPIFQSGVFNTPVGATDAAPLFPGDA